MRALWAIATAVTMNAEVPIDAAAWQIVNDGVMGGVSSSAVRALGAGGLRFEGRLSLDYGGGFASARRSFSLPGEVAVPSVSAFALRVRGDGRQYRLTVFMRDPRTGEREPYHYQGAFKTSGDEQEIVLPLADFVARFRGRPVDAPLLDPQRIIAIGLQISDRQAGPFVLDVRSIALVTPR